MPPKVKICGLADEAAVKATVAAGADYLGFVHFLKSPRHVSLERAAELKKLLPASVSSVLVVVDPDDALVQQINVLKPAAIQLHGKESPERVAEIKSKLPDVKIMKAISVKSADDVAAARRYIDAVDMLLFDARAPELPTMLPGGNGLSFDWAFLKNREFEKPWFLSGGLTPENVREAITSSGARMVDVSSGVESAPGVKDIVRIQAFIKAAKNA